MNVTKSIFNKFLLLILILVISCTLAICFGSVAVSPTEILHAIFSKNVVSINSLIIRSVRIPRIIGAIFAGAGLSVAGVLLQIIMNNVLAAPNIIGVNSGAGLFVLLVMIFVPGNYYFIPLGAFLGALAAAFFVFTIAKRFQVGKTAVVLAGVSVSGFINAVMNALFLFFPESSITISSFLYGSLSGIGLSQIVVPCVIISCILIFIIIYSKTLNVLLLGDNLAGSLGLHVERTRSLVILAAAILSGCVVSYSGLLGFVGLIVPHMARHFIGYHSRLLIPFSALLGAILVVLCDLVGRIIFIPYEIPVGIIMSFLGSPYFIYLLIHQKGMHSHAETR